MSRLQGLAAEANRNYRSVARLRGLCHADRGAAVAAARDAQTARGHAVTAQVTADGANSAAQLALASAVKAQTAAQAACGEAVQARIATEAARDEALAARGAAAAAGTAAGKVRGGANGKPGSAENVLEEAGAAQVEEAQGVAAVAGQGAADWRKLFEELAPKVKEAFNMHSNLITLQNTAVEAAQRAMDAADSMALAIHHFRSSSLGEATQDTSGQRFIEASPRISTEAQQPHPLGVPGWNLGKRPAGQPRVGPSHQILDPGTPQWQRRESLRGPITIDDSVLERWRETFGGVRPPRTRSSGLGTVSEQGARARDTIKPRTRLPTREGGESSDSEPETGDDGDTLATGTRDLQRWKFLHGPFTFLPKAWELKVEDIPQKDPVKPRRGWGGLNPDERRERIKGVLTARILALLLLDFKIRSGTEWDEAGREKAREAYRVWESLWFALRGPTRRQFKWARPGLEKYQEQPRTNGLQMLVEGLRNLVDIVRQIPQPPHLRQNLVDSQAMILHNKGARNYEVPWVYPYDEGVAARLRYFGRPATGGRKKRRKSQPVSGDADKEAESESSGDGGVESAKDEIQPKPQESVQPPPALAITGWNTFAASAASRAGRRHTSASFPLSTARFGTAPALGSVEEIIDETGKALTRNNPQTWGTQGRAGGRGIPQDGARGGSNNRPGGEHPGSKTSRGGTGVPIPPSGQTKPTPSQPHNGSQTSGTLIPETQQHGRTGGGGIGQTPSGEANLQRPADLPPHMLTNIVPNYQATNQYKQWLADNEGTLQGDDKVRCEEERKRFFTRYSDYWRKARPGYAELARIDWAAAHSEFWGQPWDPAGFLHGRTPRWTYPFGQKPSGGDTPGHARDGGVAPPPGGVSGGPADDGSRGAQTQGLGNPMQGVEGHTQRPWPWLTQSPIEPGASKAGPAQQMRMINYVRRAMRGFSPGSLSHALLSQELMTIIWQKKCFDRWGADNAGWETLSTPLQDLQGEIKRDHRWPRGLSRPQNFQNDGDAINWLLHLAQSHSTDATGQPGAPVPPVTPGTLTRGRNRGEKGGSKGVEKGREKASDSGHPQGSVRPGLHSGKKPPTGSSSGNQETERAHGAQPMGTGHDRPWGDIRTRLQWSSWARERLIEYGFTLAMIEILERKWADANLLVLTHWSPRQLGVLGSVSTGNTLTLESLGQESETALRSYAVLNPAELRQRIQQIGSASVHTQNTRAREDAQPTAQRGSPVAQQPTPAPTTDSSSDPAAKGSVSQPGPATPRQPSTKANPRQKGRKSARFRPVGGGTAGMAGLGGGSTSTNPPQPQSTHTGKGSGNGGASTAAAATGGGGGSARPNQPPPGDGGPAGMTGSIGGSTSTAPPKSQPKHTGRASGSAGGGGGSARRNQRPAGMAESIRGSTSTAPPKSQPKHTGRGSGTAAGGGGGGGGGGSHVSAPAPTASLVGQRGPETSSTRIRERTQHTVGVVLGTANRWARHEEQVQKIADRMAKMRLRLVARKAAAGAPRDAQARGPEAQAEGRGTAETEQSRAGQVFGVEVHEALSAHARTLEQARRDFISSQSRAVVCDENNKLRKRLEKEQTKAGVPASKTTSQEDKAAMDERRAALRALEQACGLYLRALLPNERRGALEAWWSTPEAASKARIIAWWSWAQIEALMELPIHKLGELARWDDAQFARIGAATVSQIRQWGWDHLPARTIQLPAPVTFDMSKFHPQDDVMPYLGPSIDPKTMRPTAGEAERRSQLGLCLFCAEGDHKEGGCLYRAARATEMDRVALSESMLHSREDPLFTGRREAARLKIRQSTASLRTTPIFSVHDTVYPYGGAGICPISGRPSIEEVERRREANLCWFCSGSGHQWTLCLLRDYMASEMEGKRIQQGVAMAANQRELDDYLQKADEAMKSAIQYIQEQARMETNMAEQKLLQEQAQDIQESYEEYHQGYMQWQQGEPEGRAEGGEAPMDPTDFEYGMFPGVKGNRLAISRTNFGECLDSGESLTGSDPGEAMVLPGEGNNPPEVTGAHREEQHQQQQLKSQEDTQKRPPQDTAQTHTEVAQGGQPAQQVMQPKSRTGYQSSTVKLLIQLAQERKVQGAEAQKDQAQASQAQPTAALIDAPQTPPTLSQRQHEQEAAQQRDEQEAGAHRAVKARSETEIASLLSRATEAARRAVEERLQNEGSLRARQEDEAGLERAVGSQQRGTGRDEAAAAQRRRDELKAQAAIDAKEREWRREQERAQRYEQTHAPQDAEEWQIDIGVNEAAAAGSRRVGKGQEQTSAASDEEREEEGQRNQGNQGNHGAGARDDGDSSRSEGNKPTRPGTVGGARVIMPMPVGGARVIMPMPRKRLGRVGPAMPLPKWQPLTSATSHTEGSPIRSTDDMAMGAPGVPRVPLGQHHTPLAPLQLPAPPLPPPPLVLRRQAKVLVEGLPDYDAIGEKDRDKAQTEQDVQELASRTAILSIGSASPDWEEHDSDTANPRKRRGLTIARERTNVSTIPRLELPLALLGEKRKKSTDGHVIHITSLRQRKADTGNKAMPTEGLGEQGDDEADTGGGRMEVDNAQLEFPELLAGRTDPPTQSRLPSEPPVHAESFVTGSRVGNLTSNIDSIFSTLFQAGSARVELEPPTRAGRPELPSERVIEGNLIDIDEGEDAGA